MQGLITILGMMHIIFSHKYLVISQGNSSLTYNLILSSLLYQHIRLFSFVANRFEDQTLCNWMLSSIEKILLAGSTLDLFFNKFMAILWAGLLIGPINLAVILVGHQIWFKHRITDKLLLVPTSYTYFACFWVCLILSQ